MKALLQPSLVQSCFAFFLCFALQSRVPSQAGISGVPYGLMRKDLAVFVFFSSEVLLLGILLWHLSLCYTQNPQNTGFNSWGHPGVSKSTKISVEICIMWCKSRCRIWSDAMVWALRTLYQGFQYFNHRKIWYSCVELLNKQLLTATVIKNIGPVEKRKLDLFKWLRLQINIKLSRNHLKVLKCF